MNIEQIRNKKNITEIMIHTAMMIGMTLFMGVSVALYFLSDMSARTNKLVINELPYILIITGFFFTFLSLIITPIIKIKISEARVAENIEDLVGNHIKSVLMIELAGLISGVAFIITIINNIDFSNILAFLPIVGYIVYMLQMIKYFPREN